MAHDQQRDFFHDLKTRFPHLFKDVTVLEVGSLNINGTVRDFFDATEYVDADVALGPDVDVVCQGQDLDYADGSFDVAVSAECFEHNPYWLETFQNMHRIASVAVMFTCASVGRGEHGTRKSSPADSPFTLDWDYYRNLSADDFTSVLDFDALFSDCEFSTNPITCDLYFWGLR